MHPRFCGSVAARTRRATCPGGSRVARAPPPSAIAAVSPPPPMPPTRPANLSRTVRRTRAANWFTESGSHTHKRNNKMLDKRNHLFKLTTMTPGEGGESTRSSRRRRRSVSGGGRLRGSTSCLQGAELSRREGPRVEGIVQQHLE